MPLPANTYRPVFLTEADGTPSAVSATSGGISISALYLQYSGSEDADVAITRNVAGQLLLKDGDGSKVLSSFLQNGTNATNSLVIGGEYNGLTGPFYGAAVIGGQSHTVSADYASVLSGRQHLVDGLYASAVGGFGNGARAEGSAVLGGASNSALGTNSASVGGTGVTAEGAWSAVLGGQSSTAQGNHSVILGGQDNVTYPSASWAAVLGGRTNRVIGTQSWYSAIAGGESGLISSAPQSFLGGGQYNSVESGSRSGVLAGKNNAVSGNEAAIVGGQSNAVSGAKAAIVGGQGNQTNSEKSVLLGGENNLSNYAFRSVVAGGTGNKTEGYTDCGVFAGYNNTAAGVQSVVLGGNTNAARDVSDAAVVGGANNTISLGNSSVIAGGAHNTTNAARSLIAAGEYHLITSTSSDSAVLAGRDSRLEGPWSTAMGVMAYDRGDVAHVHGAGKGDETGSLGGHQSRTQVVFWNDVGEGFVGTFATLSVDGSGSALLTDVTRYLRVSAGTAVFLTAQVTAHVTSTYGLPYMAAWTVKAMVGRPADGSPAVIYSQSSTLDLVNEDSGSGRVWGVIAVFPSVIRSTALFGVNDSVVSLRAPGCSKDYPTYNRNYISNYTARIVSVEVAF